MQKTSPFFLELKVPTVKYSADEKCMRIDALMSKAADAAIQTIL